MKRPWWQHEAAIAWALILFFPLGIFMMWRYAPWRNRFKWVWTGAGGIVALVIVAGVVGGTESTTSDVQKEANVGSGGATATVQQPQPAESTTPQQGSQTTVPQATETPQPTKPPEPSETPEPLWENGPVTEETVRRALDDLDDLGLLRTDINPKNVTFLSVVDFEGLLVAIEFKPSGALSETDFLTIAGESTLVAMAKLFGNPLVQRVKISAMADVVDAFGNESTEFLTTATVNRATADQINWEGLASRQLSDNKHIFCIADEYVIRPLIYNKLKDTGCLTGASRAQ